MSENKLTLELHNRQQAFAVIKAVKSAVMPLNIIDFCYLKHSKNHAICGKMAKPRSADNTTRLLTTSLFWRNNSMANADFISKKPRVRKPRTTEQKIRASQQNAERYAANKERIKKDVAEYRVANKEKVKEAGKKYRDSHVEQRKATQLVYSAAKRAEKQAYAKAYRRLNPEKYKAAISAWYAANPDAMKIKKHNRRALLLAGGRLSVGISGKLMLLQRGKCAACKCDLQVSGHHLDHIIPVSKRGANTDDNVQLLCPPCNLDKNAKHPIDWAQENGRLL